MATTTAPAPSPAALKERYDGCLQAVAEQYAALAPEAQAALRPAMVGHQRAAREAWEAQDWSTLKRAFTQWHALLGGA
jgi:hypothetical protein